MNDTKANKTLSPQAALIIYHDNTRQNFYIESRKIQSIAGKPQLMNPVPMSDSVLKDLAKSYLKTNSVDMAFGDIIAPHLLYASNQVGKTVVLWHQPAMKRNLNFSSHLGIKGKPEVWVPATLYLVINSKMYIYTLANNDRPTSSTKLHYAPFFNVYQDGNVCMGTAHIGRHKMKTFEKEAERFERAFYMAEQNGSWVKEACKSDLKALWNTLIKSKVPFPSKKELQQHKRYKTLGSLINSLIKNKRDDETDNEDED